MGNTVKLNEAQLREIIAESVKKVICEIGDNASVQDWEGLTQQAQDAKGYSKGSEYNARKERQRQLFKDRAQQTLDNQVGTTNAQGYNQAQRGTQTMSFTTENGSQYTVGKGNWGLTLYGPNGYTQEMKYGLPKSIRVDQQQAQTMANWFKQFHPEVLPDRLQNPQYWMGAR
jgi:hypothetical protein